MDCEVLQKHAIWVCVHAALNYIEDAMTQEEYIRRRFLCNQTTFLAECVEYLCDGLYGNKYLN